MWILPLHPSSLPHEASPTLSDLVDRPLRSVSWWKGGDHDSVTGLTGCSASQQHAICMHLRDKQKKKKKTCVWHDASWALLHIFWMIRNQRELQTICSRRLHPHTYDFFILPTQAYLSKPLPFTFSPPSHLSHPVSLSGQTTVVSVMVDKRWPRLYDWPTGCLTPGQRAVCISATRRRSRNRRTIESTERGHVCDKTQAELSLTFSGLFHASCSMIYSLFIFTTQAYLSKSPPSTCPPPSYLCNRVSLSGQTAAVSVIAKRRWPRHDD